MPRTNIKNKYMLSSVQQIGLVLMAIATLAGLVDVSNRPRKIVSLVPSFAVAGSNQFANPLRREREEAGPHYISYSATQRTPGRTGRY